ncbi:MAG: hypothetical protein A2W98_09940 [Bacteroidetes bacterium GWF2_33_38]|nr:MAG: hypothetical protein A2W98_09940 [Bacteroidetes bacterium GWF2_33_38]OFY91604.1 MAG: hypothetical protein A2236_11415 [Bacteroidetes bacterium RIFOXYA2_FULL_33_7]HBX52594.1 hypothetical protein [Bacteroidales bacterium]
MESNTKYKVSGIVGAVLFHAGLIALLLFFGFSVPLPLPAEQGMEINFGYEELGQGLVETGQSAASSEQEFQEANSTNEKTGSETPTLTQNFENAVSIKNKTNETNSTTNVEKQNQTQVVKEQQVNTNALFPGNGTGNGNSGNGAGNSDGNTGGNGNQGSLNGGNDRGDGGAGTGNGISFNLSGRKPEALPKPEYNSQEEGKVVVDVTVDRFGVVVKAIPGVKGSTTTDKTLWAAAKKAAEKTKFTKKADAPEEQKGTITYHFILQ